MTSLAELHIKFATAQFLIDNFTPTTHQRQLIRIQPKTFSSTPAAAETHQAAFIKKHRAKPQHRG